MKVVASPRTCGASKGGLPAKDWHAPGYLTGGLVEVVLVHCVEGETCAQKLTDIISAVVELLKLYPGGAVAFGLY